MPDFTVVNLRTLITILGEDTTQDILSAFSCAPNLDVQNFLRTKAIDFMKQGWGQTHLVFALYKGERVLAGYFTLANKFITLPSNAMPHRRKRKLEKLATYDNNLQSYYLAIPLIAQLGKNFTNGYNELMTGDELIDMACNKVKEIQLDLGGRFVYVECEDKPKLIGFYERHGFREFDRRQVEPDETGVDGRYFIQMIRMFDGNEYT